MLHEAPAEILERARILALQLNTILRVAQAFQHDSQAALFVHASPRLEAIKEGGLVARISAAADADHGERQRHPRISEAEIQGRSRAHRTANDVRFAHAEVSHHDGDIVDCMLVRIVRQGLRHLRWRISAGIECDAAMATAEILKLFLPAPQIAGKLMREYDRCPGAGFFVVQPCTFRLDIRHIALRS